MLRLASWVLVALASLLLASCAVEEPAAPAPTTAAHAPTTSASQLQGLTASVYQSRMDVAAGQVEAQLTNGSGIGFTVRRLSLESTGFRSPMTSGLSGIMIGPGRVVDLPVPLGGAVCAGDSLAYEVHLDYELDDGRTGTVVVPASDQGGRMADLHAAQCLASEADTVATLTLTGPPEERELAGTLVADLTVAVAPAGGTGELELVRVRNTTLLQFVDPDTGERQPDGHPVAVTVAGGDNPSTIVLTVVPACCDAHAIADDKQGTRFRVDVRLDGREGTVTVAAPEVTTALYGFVQRACAG
ncbi:MAG: hypothetical protein GX555_07320 [Actinomycetales bacterium]|nr:hypothetical protein [Actinomycetales bacterium]